MSEHKITVPGGESVRLLTAGKYCDRDVIVTAEGGTASEDLDEVLTEQEALIDELQDALRGKGSAWYDAFWDAYQDFGNRINYAGAFAGIGWNEKTFKPKYPVIISGQTTSERMFNYFNRISVDVSGDLFDFTAFNDLFDFSKCTKLDYTFNNARIKNLYVNAESATVLNTTFASGNGGVIDDLTLRVTATCTKYNGTFGYQYNTENIIFTEDSEISADMPVGACRKLSRASITSIVSALSDTASGKTVTFSTTAVTNAFGSIESEEWLALVGTKPNWTFAYA